MCEFSSERKTRDCQRPDCPTSTASAPPPKLPKDDKVTGIWTKRKK